MVGRIPGQRGVEIREAADLHTGNGSRHVTLGRLSASEAGRRITPTRLTFGQVALQRAHVAQKDRLAQL